MVSRLKIGFYSPYLDTLGGGEKYLFDIAGYLSSKHNVFIFWDNNLIASKAEKRFDIKLNQIHFIPNIFNKRNAFKTSLKSRDFDVIFYVSDGSIPLLFSKKNFVILQFPVNWVKVNPLLKLKLLHVNKLICYSEFVKKSLIEKFKRETIVIPPFIDIEKKEKTKKENIILSVGRFTKAMNTKKQEVLIDVFKKMFESGLKDWKLILIGSYREEDVDYFEQIKKLASGFPIEVLGNISHDELINYYNKSKIYWHAAGYGEDLDTYPEKAEHFGISTVEAMTTGSVPLVFNGGGQKEIVEDKKDGFLWENTEELAVLTTKLIKSPNVFSVMSSQAKKISERFSKEVFCRRIENLVTS